MSWLWCVGSVVRCVSWVVSVGLMAKPDGSIIETPIMRKFREGIYHYFSTTSYNTGDRKGSLVIRLWTLKFWLFEDVLWCCQVWLSLSRLWFTTVLIVAATDLKVVHVVVPLASCIGSCNAKMWLMQKHESSAGRFRWWDNVVVEAAVWWNSSFALYTCYNDMVIFVSVRSWFGSW